MTDDITHAHLHMHQLIPYLAITRACKAQPLLKQSSIY